MKTSFGTILGLGGIALCATLVRAQPAVVSGSVVTPSGKGIAGALVRLVSSKDEQIGRKADPVQSDVDGRFRVTCDWGDVAKATQAGGVWEVRAEKKDYASGRANVLLAPGKAPRVLKIVLSPHSANEELMSKVDGCADLKTDSKTLYVFDFTTDSATPQKFSTFHQLLGFKLKNAVRTHLEEAGLLAGAQFEIKSCHHAPVLDDDDAIYAANRLGCSGVVSGYIEERAGQLSSVVRFTTRADPQLTAFAPVTFSSDVSQLIRPGEQVDPAYLAFSAFVLGQLYLAEDRAPLASKCFLHAKTLWPGSKVAEGCDEFLRVLERSNPARDLRPIGGPKP